jgi:hypothetical protein
VFGDLQVVIRSRCDKTGVASHGEAQRCVGCGAYKASSFTQVTTSVYPHSLFLQKDGLEVPIGRIVDDPLFFLVSMANHWLTVVPPDQLLFSLLPCIPIFASITYHAAHASPEITVQILSASPIFAPRVIASEESNVVTGWSPDEQVSNYKCTSPGRLVEFRATWRSQFYSQTRFISIIVLVMSESGMRRGDICARAGVLTAPTSACERFSRFASEFVCTETFDSSS